MSPLSFLESNADAEHIIAAEPDEASTAAEQKPPTLSESPATTSEQVVQEPPKLETLSSFPGNPLAPGSKGEAVVQLQEMLFEAGFYREKIDGIFGKQTQAAVTAAQKALGQPVEKQWREEHWLALQAYQGPSLPERPAQPDRVEIDLEKQVLYLVKADQVVAIMPISSGNGETYEDRWGHKVQADTPVGNYTLYRRLNGWRESYLGRLYRPWYFFEGYAVHGSASVPPKPASHGCVRVPMWDADYLAEELELGMPLYVWAGSENERSRNETDQQQRVDPTADTFNVSAQGAES
jgi:lipoprotein-anchoring transpeptidase ErfK/SrfK